MTSLNQDMAFKLLFIKTLNLWNFWAVLKPCLDLMMSFKNCIRIRIAIFWRPAYYFWRLRRCHISVNWPCALGGVGIGENSKRFLALHALTGCETVSAFYRLLTCSIRVNVKCRIKFYLKVVWWRKLQNIGWIPLYLL